MSDSSFSDDELRDRIREVKRDEEQVSYERRMLHGRIDVVRSEILAAGRPAHRRRGATDDLAPIWCGVSADALTHTGPPPIDEELERFGASDELAARAAATTRSRSCPSCRRSRMPS